MRLKKFLNKYLPHEILFTAFLAVLTTRLYIHTGFSAFSALFTFITVLCGVWGSCFRNRQIIRLGFYFILMNMIFVPLGSVSPLINAGKVDGLLQHWDNILIGGNMSLWLEPYMSSLLTEILAVCYMLFMIHLYAACFYYLFMDKKHAKGFYAGLFSLYAFGFTGYIFFPAVGPYLAMADSFATPVTGWHMTDLLHYMYPKGTNYTDVFPSLHCAVSAFILFFDCQYHKLRFRWYLLPCIGLWFSTVYLRYHYFVDCLAGFVLAAAILLATRYYMDRIAEKGEAR